MSSNLLIWCHYAWKKKKKKKKKNAPSENSVEISLVNGCMNIFIFGLLSPNHRPQNSLLLDWNLEHEPLLYKLISKYIDVSVHEKYISVVNALKIFLSCCWHDRRIANLLGRATFCECQISDFIIEHINGLVQKRLNSIANTLELSFFLFA